MQGCVTAWASGTQSNGPSLEIAPLIDTVIRLHDARFAHEPIESRCAKRDARIYSLTALPGRGCPLVTFSVCERVRFAGAK